MSIGGDGPTNGNVRSWKNVEELAARSFLQFRMNTKHPTKRSTSSTTPSTIMKAKGRSSGIPPTSLFARIHFLSFREAFTPFTSFFLFPRLHFLLPCLLPFLLLLSPSSPDPILVPLSPLPIILALLLSSRPLYTNKFLLTKLLAVCLENYKKKKKT